MEATGQFERIAMWTLLWNKQLKFLKCEVYVDTLSEGIQEGKDQTRVIIGHGDERNSDILSFNAEKKKIRFSPNDVDIGNGSKMAKMLWYKGQDALLVRKEKNYL